MSIVFEAVYMKTTGALDKIMFDLMVNEFDIFTQY